MPVASRDDSFARRYMDVVHTYYQGLLQSYQEENARLRSLNASIHALAQERQVLGRAIHRARCLQIGLGEDMVQVEAEIDRDLAADYRKAREIGDLRRQKETCELRIREIFIQIRVIQDYFLTGEALLQAEIPDYSQSVSYSPK